VGITRSVGSVLVLRSDPCTQIDGHHGSRKRSGLRSSYRRRPRPEAKLTSASSSSTDDDRVVSLGKSTVVQEMTHHY
jgi:hypothetical protein